MPGTWGTPLLWRGPYAMSVVESDHNGGTDSNRWLYTLRPVNWDYNETTAVDYTNNVSAVADSFSFENCINIWEINNDSTTAMGLPVAGSQTELRPAPINAVVLAWMMPAPIDVNGIKCLVVFQWPNQWACL